LLESTKKLTSLGNANVHVDLIAGLPFESYDIFKKSFNDAYGLAADTLQIGFLKLLKGTGMRAVAESSGYVFRGKAPYEIISNSFLSAEDVCRLKRIEEMVSLYYNRGGFGKTVEYMISTFAGRPFDFYEEFSIYYCLKGYQHKSHKKEDLYRILHGYALWKSRKLEIPMEEISALIADDMSDSLNPEALKKFEKKGWDV